MNPLYFGRKYRLTIDIPDKGTSVYEVEPGKPAMDIKFDVTYARGQTAREGTLSILGLRYDTITEFIRLAAKDRGAAMKEFVHVRLEAGYFSAAGMVEVFDGFAYSATVTSPPQMWLNININEYNPRGGIDKIDMGDPGPMSLGALSRHMMALIGAAEGVTIEVIDKTEDGILDKIENIHLPPKSSFSLAQAINCLNQHGSDKVQFILRTHMADSDTRHLEAHDIDSGKQVRADPVIVNKDNGLLSVTGITAVDGRITTFIDGRWEDELSHLDLTSELNPHANGLYSILKKQYVGHYMGQEWYTIYTCSARQKE